MKIYIITIITFLSIYFSPQICLAEERFTAIDDNTQIISEDLQRILTEKGAEYRDSRWPENINEQKVSLDVVPQECLDHTVDWIRTMVKDKWLPDDLKNRMIAIPRKSLSEPDYLIVRYILDGYKIQIQENGIAVMILIETNNITEANESIEDFLTSAIYEFLNYPTDKRDSLQYRLNNFKYNDTLVYYGQVDCDFDISSVNAEMLRKRIWWNHTYCWTDGKRVYLGMVEMDGIPYTGRKLGSSRPGFRERFGMKILEEKISKMPAPELAEMLRHDEDFRNAAVALRCLRADLPANIDLLLNIAAETRSNMIIEGLVKPIKTSAILDEKLVVDKYLDFLEAQLKEDKPSVSREQAIRSIAQTVRIKFRKGWNRPLMPYGKGVDPNKLEVPYANTRVINILASCLDSNDVSIRTDAIRLLGFTGANDLNKVDEIKSLLDAQIIKEETRTEDPEIKAKLKEEIRDALRRLNNEIRYFKQVKQIMELQTGRPVDSNELRAK